MLIRIRGKRYKWNPLRTLTVILVGVLLLVAIGLLIRQNEAVPMAEDVVYTPAIEEESLEDVSYPLETLLLLIVDEEPVVEEAVAEPALYTEEELYLLARLIHGEARGESFEGQLAVGTVVLNRAYHPNQALYGGPTIEGVVYKRRQFCAVREAAWNDEPTESSLKAARQVLDGYRSFGPDVVYFFNATTASNASFMASVDEVGQIGRHTFAQ